MKNRLFSLALLALAGAACAAPPADAQRQAEVAQRGADVMPFSLQQTTHVFTKTARGGTQRVVAKDPRNAAQVRLVRAHLRDLREQFQNGDYSGPEHIHGHEMPGLAELRAARPGQISMTYREVKGGAELAYRTSDATLATALHQWFDAQLSDHGSDAMAGPQHHHTTSP